MKFNKILMSSLMAMTCLGLVTSCGKESLKIQVGSESVAFYKKVVADYVAANAEKFEKYNVDVIGADTGAAAGVMMNDPEASGDIITIAHDNIGKLVSGFYIQPIINESLKAQVEADNPQTFKDVLYYAPEKGGEKYLYAVPYISQALVLFYNKAKVTDEQAKSFEGLQAAAKAQGDNVKALVNTGTDGFNFSYTVLARNNETKETSVRIYKDFVKDNTWFQGDDTVAVHQWAQRMYNDPNGCMFPGSDSWETVLSTGKALSVIGGAWQFDAARSAIGASNIGAKLIPTFTLTENDVEGTTIAPNTVMRGGSFADCKTFVINSLAEGEKYDLCCDIVKYLSTGDMQKQSFVECLNVPAFNGAGEFIEQAKKDGKIDQAQYEAATSQLGMAEYGIAQPFINTVLNNYYYQSQGDGLLKQIIMNEADKNGVKPYDTTAKIRQGLYSLQHIWEKGKLPEQIPAELPAQIGKVN